MTANLSPGDSKAAQHHADMELRVARIDNLTAVFVSNEGELVIWQSDDFSIQRVILDVSTIPVLVAALGRLESVAAAKRAALEMYKLAELRAEEDGEESSPAT